MQTVWAALSGASDQEEPVPSAGSADAGASKPQVAVITAAGQAAALLDIPFGASSQAPAFLLICGMCSGWQPAIVMITMKALHQKFQAQYTCPRRCLYAAQICIFVNMLTEICVQACNKQLCRTLLLTGTALQPDLTCLVSSLIGPIFAGSATPSPLRKQSQISSNELGMELQKARHDPKVKAVVLRVDSPGAAPPYLSITCCLSNTCKTYCSTLSM